MSIDRLIYNTGTCTHVLVLVTGILRVVTTVDMYMFDGNVLMLLLLLPLAPSVQVPTIPNNQNSCQPELHISYKY